ncbi:MAG TPA: hypothetical protein DDZ53_01795, partial [Firmicutes bacterium]|nr:hypothetical protein [Bacillota bacterium]
GASRTNAYYESALSGVQKVAEAWQGELNWRCVISGGVITRYVDLLAMRGADTGKQFTYSKDILNIEREVDTSGIVTALYGRGKGIELDSGSYGRRLTFAEITAPDKPTGQEWVGDSDALAQWGRPGGRHRFGVFVDEEETDPAKLLQKIRDELDRRKTPRATYRLDVVSLEELTGYEHEKVRLGDMVRVIDREFEPELVVSARVIEIERDILDPANTKVVLGSFAPTIVEATINIARRVDQMVNKPYNTKWLDGKIDVLQNAIENTQSYVFQTGDDGILILDAATYDQATQAMKLGGGIFAIANQKDGQGGWNWRTFGDGSGFTADLITAGIIDAGLITVGPETTFAPGYDPTLIDPSASATMGVDSDCLGLWHFDGSLNSHKGVSAIGDENFDAGCFGQAVKIEEGTTNVIINGEDIQTQANNTGSGTATKMLNEAIPYWRVTASAGTVSTYENPIYSYMQNNCIEGQVYTISCEVRIPTAGDVSFYNNIGKNTGIPANAWTQIFHTFTFTSGYRIGGHTYAGSQLDYRHWQLEQKPYATPFVDGTRLGSLKAPASGLSPSQGTISLRAKNLSASANGAVLIDLPKSDNTQGIKAGISNVTGHEGEVFITDSPKASKSYTETTQADFNSGTLTDVVATSAGDLELKTARNSMGKALSFDGVDDYVDCGNKASLNFTSRVTLEAWIKGNAFNLWSDIVSKGVSYGDKVAYMLGVSNDGHLLFEINVGGVRYNVTWSGMQQYVGQWVHVAGVYDRSRLILYINGEEKAAISLNNLDIDIVSTPVRICAPSRYFNGIIDDVRIWNIARTQQQIRDNMNKELVGNESGLVGYWKFNEGSGATAYDSTPNANNGAINGASWADGLVASYKSPGTREKIVDLTGANPAAGTKIEWSKTTPANTTVKVETALSTDGGSTYGAYAEATSGNGIPGIASDTDLSNAKLKIKETLSTTDTSITPKLHSLSFTIWEKQATTVYGPNKSTLTAWDSMALAWKSDRLSLVVNDTEA